MVKYCNLITNQPRGFVKKFKYNSDINNINMNNKIIIFIVAMCFLAGNLISGQGLGRTGSLKRAIVKKAPSEEAYMAVLELAQPYFQQGEWQQAVRIFEDYKHLFPNMTWRFERTIDMLLAKEEGWIVEVMNHNINSMQFNEFNAMPTYDGKYLYFSSDRQPMGYGKEDVFVSELVDGRWTPAVNLNGYINTASSEAPTSISFDGLQIVLFGNYPGTLGRGDLFVSQFVDTTWSPVTPFPPPVNTRYYESDGIYSPDGRAFFFTSDRPGGIGGYHKKDEFYHGSYAGNQDIYVIVKTGFGTWSEPVNLGPVINTPYCEQDPYITPDGDRMYFSSDGHYGLGRMDIFVSHRTSDTSWVKWSQPVNLGKEINTIWDDVGYVWDASGDSAFYSIATNGRLDIYTVKHPSVLPPKIDTVLVAGSVTGSNGLALKAVISAEDAESGKPVSTVTADSLTGEFLLPLEDNHRYIITAVMDGYSLVSQTISLGDMAPDSTAVLNFTLQYIPVEEAPDAEETVDEPTAAAWNPDQYRFDPILFEFRRYDISKKYFPRLDSLAKYMNEHPDMLFEISGHTDNIGTEEDNMILADNRVKSVLAYLKLRGITKDRFQIQIAGSGKPVKSNDSEEGRRLNRRVEVKPLTGEETSVSPEKIPETEPSKGNTEGDPDPDTLPEE